MGCRREVTALKFSDFWISSLVLFTECIDGHVDHFPLDVVTGNNMLEELVFKTFYLSG